MITYRNLSFALLGSWSIDTAYKKDTLLSCPAKNQCCVTALVVQDYLGGQIVRKKINKTATHFWNILPDGNEIDFTFSQFDSAIMFNVTGEICDRKNILKHKDIRKRYEILKLRVKSFIGEK